MPNKCQGHAPGVSASLPVAYGDGHRAAGICKNVFRVLHVNAKSLDGLLLRPADTRVSRWRGVGLALQKGHFGSSTVGPYTTVADSHQLHSLQLLLITSCSESCDLWCKPVVIYGCLLSFHRRARPTGLGACWLPTLDPLCTFHARQQPSNCQHQPMQSC